MVQDPTFDYNQNLDESGKEVQITKGPLYAFDTDTLTLYLKYIPMVVKREDLLNTLKTNLEGFVHLSMSEPMRNNNFSRLAWAMFSNEHDLEQALQKIPSLTIDSHELSAAKSIPNKKRTPVRITPPLPADLLKIDYSLCVQLIQNVFDAEKGISSFVVEKIEKTDEGDNSLSLRSKLDLLLLYLRRVHSFCLYCCEEYEDERMLSTRCGPQHIRHYQQIPDDEFDEILTKNNQEEKSQSNEQEVTERPGEVTAETISSLKP